MDSFFFLVILAGAVAGASTGLLGVYVVGMRMPFIGICISHSAMVGIIYSLLLGINPVWGPIIFSTLSSMSLGVVRPGRSRIDANVALAIFFNLMLGLTFLGIGLTQGSRTEVLGLLWGSLLFVRKSSVVVITISGLAFAVFAALFNKELKVLLFSRTIAAATGVHESFVYCIFLGLCGLILAVNLPLVGGLMIFSLITCPAAAAYQICTGHKSVIVAATFFGMASAVIGFLVSYYLNLPTGACIVIISALFFTVSALYRTFKDQRD
ncbi:MAG TPA: cation ABC transporter permease [Phycisphaerales bacterium]|nr:cation ABC transporter permease [Phycisphaerales bacterium]